MGGWTGNRTWDPFITSQVLYQLIYLATGYRIRLTAIPTWNCLLKFEPFQQSLWGNFYHGYRSHYSISYISPKPLSYWQPA
jgi:hypothetical protein